MNARRDAIVLTVLITAVMLLIWNGSSFFHHLPIGGPSSGRRCASASTALTLNVALILFGWRRYVDLQHEAEMRAEQERRAVVLATTDSITGLYNRKGFADAPASCAPRPGRAATISSSSPSRSTGSRRSTTSTAMRPATGC